MKIKTRFILVVSLLFNLCLLNAQILITSGEEVTPQDLVENIVGEGVQYFNVQYQGDEAAKGIFTNGSSTNLGIESGIILSSGYANLIEGPNDDCSISVNHGLPGDNYLNGLVYNLSYDAAVLQFDIIPESDTLKINYVFGSDEYDEYVDYAGVDDVFGCFIWGPNPDTAFWNYNGWNFAIVPGTINSCISIKNINNGDIDCDLVPNGPCNNCEYYINNAQGLTIQYDGFTTVLKAEIPVIPCETYHLKLAIADVGGDIIDSGVAIEANSINVPLIEVETISSNSEISENMVEGCVEMDLVFRLPNASYAPTTIDLEFATGPGFAENGLDFSYIDPYITFEEGQDSVSIHINALDDNLVEGDELLEIIIINDLGCQVRYDTISYIIQEYYDMIDTISPPQVLCEYQGDSAAVWLHVSGGIPPYSYLWEPGGQTTDSIWVGPDSTTTYIVSYTDLCGKTSSDSTYITVYHQPYFETYYFEAALNPGLEDDVFGTLLNETVNILLPPATNPNGLIASFTCDGDWVVIIANGIIQESGITLNDFTNPVVYTIYGPTGCPFEWTVFAEVEVGQNENFKSDIQIFPNPANDQLNILNANGYKVSLVSNLGVEVYSNTIKNKKQTIDINHLEPGIYYLKFENEEVEFVRKVVVEK